jgi:MFS family permease
MLSTQKKIRLNKKIETFSVHRKPDSAVATKNRTQVIWTLTTAITTIALVGVGFSLSMTLLSVRLGEQGYSAHAIGLNPAAGGIASLISASFVPGWAQKFGLRQVLFIALLVSGLCLCAFALSDDYWTWLFLRAVFGASLTALFVLSEYWINSSAPPARRGLIMGLYATSLALGFVAGPAALSLMGTEGSLPFFGGVGLFALAALPILLGGSDTPEIETRSQISPLAFLTAAPVATLAGFLHGGIETASMSLLPVYGLLSGLTPEAGASLVSLFALGNVLAQIPIGFLSDRIDRRRLLMAIALFGLIGSLLLPIIGPTHFYTFAAMLTLWGGVLGSLYVTGLAHLGARYNGPELASANAAFVMLYSMGMLVGPPIMGIGMDIVPPNGFFFALAVMLAGYLAIIGRRTRTKTKLVRRP